MVCTEVGRRGSYVQSWKCEREYFGSACVYSTRQKASEFTRWRSTRRDSHPPGGCSEHSAASQHRPQTCREYRSLA